MNTAASKRFARLGFTPRRNGYCREGMPAISRAGGKVDYPPDFAEPSWDRGPLCISAAII